MNRSRMLVDEPQGVTKLMQNDSLLVRLLVRGIIHPRQIHGSVALRDIVRQTPEDGPVADGVVERNTNQGLGGGSDQRKRDSRVLGPLGDVFVHFRLLIGCTNIVARKEGICDVLMITS